MRKFLQFIIYVFFVSSSVFLYTSHVAYSQQNKSFKKNSSLVENNQSPARYGLTIIDSTHYSHVFAETRNYRIFLPPGYFVNTKKRYPVIYFFHGWSERYFGVTGTAGYDKGDENKGDNIEAYVATHDVIVVKPDGFNAYEDEVYKLQPYNVDPAETFRQFPIYFPEFVQYIDNNYKTIADRTHRAVSGLSMGGFMTFLIAGKYPQLVCAAGNFCGSYEFFVGPPKFPVEYRNIDVYKNYAGVNLRLNYGNKDNLRFYHQEMNSIWTQVMNNYHFKIYDAPHITCGMGEMFDFILQTFAQPLPVPKRWDHIDIYPEFSVWDYTISSNRFLSGFTILEDVDKRGFKISVRNFLPDGELMPMIKLSVTTAPVYEKNKIYTINDVGSDGIKYPQQRIISDMLGRLTIKMNGAMHNIGINKAADKPNISIASVSVQNMPWATNKKEVTVNINLLNKGLKKTRNIKATISAFKSGTEIIKGKIKFDDIDINEVKMSLSPFVFKTTYDSVEITKFKILIEDAANNKWTEFFELPLRNELPEINNFVIADGKYFTVSKAGVDSETVFMGVGNGDGIANPGESIAILVKENDRYWRTQLFSSNKYVNPFGINIRKSDNWEINDGIGPSAKYTIPVIASACPQNNTIDFAALYWMPVKRKHIIKQGQIKIAVTGIDNTPPKIDWVYITGDNTVQVKMYDGAAIKFVKVKFISKDDVNGLEDTDLKDPKKVFELILNDEGLNGDRAASDNVFSIKIPEQKFYLYTIEVHAMDAIGNELVEKLANIFILH